MQFDQRMILDGTRGSIARFVNHSCSPNCEVKKRIVKGQPRIALFAKEDGIMTGEELTYDYNFQNFSQQDVQSCRCGAANCRGIIGPKPKEPKEPKEAVKQMAESTKRKASQLLDDAKELFKDPLGSKKRKLNTAKGVKKISKSSKSKQVEEESAQEKEPGKEIKEKSWKGWVKTDEPPVVRNINEQDPEAIIAAARRKRREAKEAAAAAAQKSQVDTKPELKGDDEGEAAVDESRPRAKKGKAKKNLKSCRSRAGEAYEKAKVWRRRRSRGRGERQEAKGTNGITDFIGHD